MATTFDFVVSCPEERLVAARQTLEEAHRLVHRLELELTEFIASSPIAQINASLPGTPIAVAQSAIDLLVMSEDIRESTDGAFSCLAKSALPEEAKIQWDLSRKVAWRASLGTHLGFGAIGKGYALDQVRALVERSGFQDYFLSGGGSSLILSGFSSPEIPWKWGWSWQKDSDGETLGVSFVHESGLSVAIGVSGLHEKGLHIIDPRKGDPAQSVKSALVAHPSATQADALSTALFVGGWEEEYEHFSKLTTPPAMAIIDHESTPRWNGTFQHLWGKVSTIGGHTVMLLVAIASFFPYLARADDAVDLGGADDFTPYIFERNYWFTLLPLAALGIVLLHLKKLNSRPQTQPNPLEENHET